MTRGEGAGKTVTCPRLAGLEMGLQGEIGKLSCGWRGSGETTTAFPAATLLPSASRGLPVLPCHWQFVSKTLLFCFLLIAVNRGYDTCFSVQACHGLYKLIKSMRSDWDTIRVSIDRVDLGQTHCKQVPDFFSLHFPPSGQYGLCFGYCFSGPLPLCSHFNRLPFVESVTGSPY